jgi:hypothetical protein
MFLALEHSSAVTPTPASDNLNHCGDLQVTRGSTRFRCCPDRAGDANLRVMSGNSGALHRWRLRRHGQHHELNIETTDATNVGDRIQPQTQEDLHKLGEDPTETFRQSEMATAERTQSARGTKLHRSPNPNALDSIRAATAAHSPRPRTVLAG